MSAIDHDFQPVAGHPDDDECTYRSDGTDATYCGEPESAHEFSSDDWLDYDYEPDPIEHTDRMQDLMCDDTGLLTHRLVLKIVAAATFALLIYGYWPRGIH